MNKLLSAAGFTILILLLLHACKKNSAEVEIETRVGTYLKNELGIPVYMQNGYRYAQGNKDTTFISDKIQIVPGGIVKYNQYPGNLTGMTTPRTSYVSPANTFWLTINNKVKRDYFCPVLSNANEKAECENDPVNFFRSTEKWIEIQHPEKDSISRIYTINASDSLEAIQ
jgi:hypothetical protein